MIDARSLHINLFCCLIRVWRLYENNRNSLSDLSRTAYLITRKMATDSCTIVDSGTCSTKFINSHILIGLFILNSKHVITLNEISGP